MDFSVNFRRMQSSLPLFAYAQKKLGDKIDEYTLGLASGDLTFEADEGLFRVSCHVGGSGRNALDVRSDDEFSMYRAIDKLASALDSSLKQRKSRAACSDG